MNLKEQIESVLDQLDYLVKSNEDRSEKEPKPQMKYYLQGKSFAYLATSVILENIIETTEEKPMKSRFFLLWKTPTKSGWGYYFSPVSYRKKEVADAEARRLKKFNSHDNQEFIRVVEVEIE